MKKNVSKTFDLKLSNFNFLRFNDDSFINKKLSLQIEKYFKEKYLSEKEDLIKYKPEYGFPIKLVRKLIFEEMKINSNCNDLFYIKKGFELRLIDDSFLNDNTEFWKHNLKCLLDFFKCNILYEDIPIYKEEYSDLIFHLKKYIHNYYFLRFDQLDFYEIVYYAYCRKIILSLINYYNNNISKVKIQTQIGKDDNKYSLEYLIFFGHHRTQNSILKLLIPIDNFKTLYEILHGDSDEFSIISNNFCGILKFELISDLSNFQKSSFLNENELDNNIKLENDLLSKSYCCGYKIFYENFDITHMVNPKILGNKNKKDLSNYNCKNNKEYIDLFKENNYFIDMSLFKEFIAGLEKQFQNLDFNSIQQIELL